MSSQSEAPSGGDAAATVERCWKFFPRADVIGLFKRERFARMRAGALKEKV